MWIEPLRPIVSNARRKYVRFPGPRGEVEALQLFDDAYDIVRTCQSGRFRDVLPDEEKTHHLSSRNGFDGSAKS
jgi:hypothetical protein